MADRKCYNKLKIIRYELQKIKLFLILIIISAPGILYADISMQNVSGREKQSLNGVWNILIDAYDEGLKKMVYP